MVTPRNFLLHMDVCGESDPDVVQLILDNAHRSFGDGYDEDMANNYVWRQTSILEARRIPPLAPLRVTGMVWASPTRPFTQTK